MQVFVVVAGRTHTLLGVETVDDVKSYIFMLEGIAPREQRLMIGCKTLEGRLGDHGVRPQVTIHLLGRLRGGLPWDRILMCAQAFQLVWPKVQRQGTEKIILCR